jgi:trimeric autotransporter adhesin
MKKILIFLLFFPVLSFAQIGINTASPKAALDVESTNNGILIPRVQLTSILDATTVVNPNAGPLETSTLIYNLAPAGVAPNNVVAGFYYWNGLQWVSISGSAISDHDWYKEGTTTAPSTITDDMFHTGNVAIGKNVADYPLDINTTNFQFGIYNTLNNPTTTNQAKATVVNDISDNTNDQKYGVINMVANNSITSGAVGVRNDLNGNGTTFFGSSNNLTAGLSSNNAEMIGVRNFISTDSNNSNLKGVYTIFDGSGGNLNKIYGMQNDFRASATRKTGTENIFNANTDGFNVGLFNSLNANLPNNDQYGVWNEVSSGSSTTGDNFGLYNLFSGSGGSGSKIGAYTRIESTGDGLHAGAVQVINGSAAGIGDKYGTSTTINSAAGGTHYGIHSTVLKPSANNFAGYFLGNVGIGTTTANTYTLPPSRGTNGQILTTNAAGVTSWSEPARNVALKIKPTANISGFTNTGETALTFNNPVFNLGGGTYNGTTGAYTIPFSGVYGFNANLTWNFFGTTATTLIVRFRIYVNGVRQEQIIKQFAILNNGYFENYPFNTTLNLTQNDVVTFRVFTVWGAAINPVINFNETSISVFKVY